MSEPKSLENGKSQEKSLFDLTNNDIPLSSKVGTPILFSKNVSSTQYNHEIVKPDLKSFAKGLFLRDLFLFTLIF